MRLLLASALGSPVGPGGWDLGKPPAAARPAPVRIAESFLWTDLITGGTPDLAKAQEVTKVLLT
jgi:hypothetical protein